MDFRCQPISLFRCTEIATDRIEPGVFDRNRRMFGELRQEIDIACPENTGWITRTNAECANDLVFPPDRSGDPGSSIMKELMIQRFRDVFIPLDNDRSLRRQHLPHLTGIGRQRLVSETLRQIGGCS